jgi:hypothetical protein
LSTLIEKAHVLASTYPRIFLEESDGIVTLALGKYAVLFVNDVIGTAFKLKEFSALLPEEDRHILKELEAFSQEGNPMELLHNALALVSVEPALTLRALSNANSTSFVVITHKPTTSENAYYLSFQIASDLHGYVVSKLDVPLLGLDRLARRGLEQLKNFERSWTQKWASQPLQSRVDNF